MENDAKWKKYAAAVVLTGAAVSSGIFAWQDQETGTAQDYIRAKKEYTVMLYVMGSDLEWDQENPEDSGAASRDLEEIRAVMEQAGLDEQAHVVAEIGGSPGWTEESLEGIQNAFITIDSAGIQVERELPDVNMGESGTVTQFIDYAYTYYPADHYMLIFWNHGDGPAQGYGYDVLHGGDSLTLRELRQAFGDAELQEFDLVGFDACCMGNIETACALSGYTEYLVASPDREDADGWDYSWMEILKNADVSPAQAAEKIVKAYGSYYERMGNGVPAVLSAYRMESLPELYDAVRECNEELLSEADEAYWTELNRVRNQIEGYSSGGSAGAGLEFLDMEQIYGHLCKDGEHQERIRKALGKFVSYTTGVGEEMCGISVYLPVKSDEELEMHVRQYMSCPYDGNYLEMVYRYARFLDQDLELNMGTAQAEYEEESMEILFAIDPEMLEETAAAYLVTALPSGQDGEYYLLSTDSDVYVREPGVLAGVLDQNYFSVAGEVLCLTEQYSSEERTVYQSPVFYRDRPCVMTVEVSLEDPDGRITSIVPVDGGGPAPKEQYILEEGAAFAAAYPVLADGEQPGAGAEPTGEYYKGDTVMLQEYDCALELMEVDFSECVYGLMLKDAAMGEHYSALSPL